MSRTDMTIAHPDVDDWTLLFQAGEAIRLTREYVGGRTLPPIQGWTWFDAYCAIAARLNNDEMHYNIGQWVDDYQRHTGTPEEPPKAGVAQAVSRWRRRLWKRVVGRRAADTTPRQEQI